MINIIIDGGFGNQLWQYALGQHLKERGRVVTFDKSRLRHEYSDGGHHRDRAKYALDRLNVNVDFGSLVGQTVVEPNMPFIPTVLDMDNVTLQGCWQSEKYLGNAEVLRNQFTCKQPPSAEAVAWAELIKVSPNPTFLHVRHGDYMLPENLKYHGVMPTAYYKAALDMIFKKTAPCEVFIFSDDPDWCRTNLPGLVVAGNNQFEDLWLMSLCKNGVIANSSYSWWGAWLGPDKNGGVVVAPKQWFVTPSLDSRDIVPKRWVTL
jgi:hypothetical protein